MQFIGGLMMVVLVLVPLSLIYFCRFEEGVLFCHTGPRTRLKELQAKFAGSGGSVAGTTADFFQSKEDENWGQPLSPGAIPPPPKTKKRMANKPQAPNPDGLHIVFSADCGIFSQWQSVVFLYHTVHTQGHIPMTMLVSGESAESCLKQIDLYTMHAGYPSLNFVFTPDFRKGPRGDDDWRFYNKPAAITFWLTHYVIDEPIIVMLDFDMILLRKLDLNVMRKEFGWTKPVGKGTPAGQRALFHAVEWGHLPHCTEDPKCLSMIKNNYDYADKEYCAGTPYFMHQDDLMKICETWYELAYQVRMWKMKAGELLGNNDEMFGYTLSSIRLDLTHLVSRKIALSAPKPPNRPFEGWDDLVAGLYDNPYMFHMSQYYRTRFDNTGAEPPVNPATIEGQFSTTLRFVKYDWGFKDIGHVPVNEVKFLMCPDQGGEVIDPRVGKQPCFGDELCISLARKHVKDCAYGKAKMATWRPYMESEPDFEQLYVMNNLISNINAAVFDWQDRHCGKNES